jgi:hypothetical protein
MDFLTKYISSSVRAQCHLTFDSEEESGFSLKKIY